MTSRLQIIGVLPVGSNLSSIGLSFVLTSHFRHSFIYFISNISCFPLLFGLLGCFPSTSTNVSTLDSFLNKGALAPGKYMLRPRLSPPCVFLCGYLLCLLRLYIFILWFIVWFIFSPYFVLYVLQL